MSSNSRIKPWEQRVLNDAQILMRHVIKTEKCWFWDGKENSHGYVHLTIRGKKVFGHRKMYEIYKGDIPEGMIVHHTCNNRACLNPDHLQLVTRSSHPGVGAPKGNHNRGGYRAYLSKQNLSN